MSWVNVGFIMYALMNLIAFGFTISALKEVNPSKPLALFSAIMKGVFADRDVFTENGWRRRNIALAVHVTSTIIFVVFILAVA